MGLRWTASAVLAVGLCLETAAPLWLPAARHRTSTRRWSGNSGGGGGETLEVSLVKPLGVRAFESRLGHESVVVVAGASEAALQQGVQVGDVIVGASAVFGDDVWSTREGGLERLRELIQYRGEGLPVRLRLERDHPLSAAVMEESAQMDAKDHGEDSFALLDPKVRAILQETDNEVLRYLEEQEREVQGSEETEAIFLDGVVATFEDSGLLPEDGKADAETCKALLDAANPIYESVSGEAEANAVRLQELQNAEAAKVAAEESQRIMRQRKLPRNAVMRADRQRNLEESAQKGVGGIRGLASKDVDLDAFNPELNACAEELQETGWGDIGEFWVGGGYAAASDDEVREVDAQIFVEELAGLRLIAPSANGTVAEGVASAAGPGAASEMEHSKDLSDLPDSVADALRRLRDESRGY